MIMEQTASHRGSIRHHAPGIPGRSCRLGHQEQGRIEPISPNGNQDRPGPGFALLSIGAARPIPWKTGNPVWYIYFFLALCVYVFLALCVYVFLVLCIYFFLVCLILCYIYFFLPLHVSFFPLCVFSVCSVSYLFPCFSCMFFLAEL